MQNRRSAVREHPPFLEGLMWRGFSMVMRRPKLYRFSAKIARLFQPLHALIQGSAVDPMKAWTGTREAPKIAKQSFTDWWKENRK